MGLSSKKVMLLAIRQVGGAAGAPTVANAILCRAVTPKPINAEQVARDLVKPYKGNSGQLISSIHREFEFEVELAGSGEAGTAPAFGLLLEGCGLMPTVLADTSVTYKPVSEGEPLLTLWCFLDGVLWKMTDAKGTVAIDANPKAIPVMKFRYIGEYEKAVDQAMPPGANFDQFITPLTVGKVNTPAFDAYGLSVCTSGFTLDLANALVYRDLINCGGPASPDRQPSGSMTFELTKVGIKDWAESLRIGETGTIHFEHGTEEGNIVEIDMPRVQMTGITSSEQDNIAMVQVPFSIQPVNGNDELALTFR